MVVADLDEIQYDLEIDGELVRRQIGRRVWQDRGWATVAIAYEERRAGGAWKPARVALLRFRHQHDMWKRQASMTLPAQHALALAEVIHTWGDELTGQGAPAADDDGD